jgi:hypothetical protein
MKKQAFVIAFGLMISATCLSQKPGWKTEHHDTMVVPPAAADVTFTERGHQDELNYTVQEPYPAQEFIDELCEQLRLKGWEPSGEGGCAKPNWIKVPPPSIVKYRADLTWAKWDDAHPNGEGLGYSLLYMTAENEHHPRTLQVDTWALHVEPAPPPKTAPGKPRRPILSDRMSIVALLLLYVSVLATIVWLLVFSKVRSALFYSGPSAWRTWINLVCFAPAVAPLLGIGVFLISGALPAKENAEGQAALVIFIYVWLILSFFSVVGAAASPLVVIFTGTIIFAENIPRNVKIGHAVLGLLSLSFWVVCIVSFRGPLIRW